MDRPSQYLPLKQSLVIGKEGEDRILAIMLKAGAVLTRGSCGGDYDKGFMYLDQEWLVEVKNEDEKEYTGNICVEHSQGLPQKDSGIMTSKAHVWIHLFKNLWVAYPRLQMLEHIKIEKSCKMLKSKIMGDNSNDCYLLNRYMLLGLQRAFKTTPKWYYEFYETALPRILSVLKPIIFNVPNLC